MESELSEVRRLRREGDTSAALDLIERLKKKSPDELVLCDLAAEIHLGREDRERAIGEYESFVERNPSNPAALNNFACLLLEGRRPKQAVETLLKAYEFDEGNVNIRCNLALAFKDLGLMDEARKVCEGLVKAHPNETIAHFIMELEIAQVGWRTSEARLPVGKIVHLMRRCQLIVSDSVPVYASRIEDVGKHRMTVTAPSRDGVTVPFCKGTKLIVGYDRKESFWGCVAAVTEGPTGNHHLVLDRPRRMKKVQKRKHFRMLWPGLLRNATLKSVPEGQAAPELGWDDVAEQDVSAAGMSLLANREIPKGSVFSLVLGLEDDEVSVEGDVVRCKQISPGGYEIGIQFARLSSDEQDRVAGFVLGKRLEKQG